MKLLYNEEELFCTKAELLNFKITLPLAKLYMVSSRLVSNDLIFSDDIPVNNCFVNHDQVFLFNFRNFTVTVSFFH